MADEPSNPATVSVNRNALKSDYAPSGETCAEQITDAARYIQEQWRVEQEKWNKYREIMGR